MQAGESMEPKGREQGLRLGRIRALGTVSVRTAFNVLPGRRALKIGLLGGSFDPPHIGHAHISDWATKKFSLDAIWWLPSPGNPLKPNKPASASARRTAMEQFHNPKVLNVEFELRTGTAFTHESISRLKNLCPNARFVWLMGADNLAQIHTWSKWDSIFEAVPVGVLARRNSKFAAMSSVAARKYMHRRIRRDESFLLPDLQPPVWVQVNIPLVDVSSSDIRRKGLWKAQAAIQ